MDLQSGWFIIPLILLGGVIYSMISGYIYGSVLIPASILASLCNLIYYIAGFFLHNSLSPLLSLVLIPFLGLMSAAWLFIGCICAYRQWNCRPSVSVCLILNLFLILTWNVLVYISYFL